jgi:lysophospholipase L1-like esterase
LERIAVFGDSVLWGQGLHPHQKIVNMVADRLGVTPENVHNFAHSGADVWEDGEKSIDTINPRPKRLEPLKADDIKNSWDRADKAEALDELARNGEAPREQPYTLKQVALAETQRNQFSPDLIILDAGINDVGTTNIILPFKSEDRLRERTKSVGNRVELLLETVHKVFPRSRIVMTGYYRIVSEHSDIATLLGFGKDYLVSWPDWRERFDLKSKAGTFMAAANLLEQKPDSLDIALSDDVAAFQTRPTLRGTLVEGFKSQLVELSNIFAETSAEVLHEQIEAFNARHGTNAKLAIPSIPPEHAIFTREPWLFGLKEDRTAEDDLIDVRKGLCDKFNVKGAERYIWERASIGHPNHLGAKAYAEAILSQLAG